MIAVVIWRASDEPLWPAREALPADVLVLEEDIYEDDFFGEFTYTLRVQITPSQFQEWMRRLELPLREGEGEYATESREGRERMDAEMRGCYSMARLVDGVGTFLATCL